MRIGQGYDIHRTKEGRRFILGGVHIPYEKGLDGHSDADVLTHAVIDALFGAMGEGDIGSHFPDDDEAYLDIDSMLLLKATIKLLRKKHYHIVNLDTTVIAQKPKLAPFIDAIRRSLAEALGIAFTDVNVKAKTEEGLGYLGSGEAVAAQAVVLIEQEEPDSDLFD